MVSAVIILFFYVVAMVVSCAVRYTKTCHEIKKYQPNLLRN
jgi:hypothetical protein